MQSRMSAQVVKLTPLATDKRSEQAEIEDASGLRLQRHRLLQLKPKITN